MSRAEKREGTRRRILDAAREIFFAEGFQAANLDDVATRAGIAKGTIYRYFASKAELYVAVLVENAEIFVSHLQQTVDPALSPEDQIRKTGLLYFRHHHANREYFQIFWALDNREWIGELSEELVEEVTHVWRRCLQVLADQIERGIREGVFLPCDPWTTAHLFWIVGNGLLQTDEHPERRELRGQPLRRVLEDSLALLIRGLRMPNPGA